MAQWLFLEDFASTVRRARAGDVFDDAIEDLDRFVREGAALIAYRPALHDPLIAQFRVQRSQNPGVQLFPILAGAYVSEVVAAVTTRELHFYVSPDGDDSRDGLTPGTALATPQEACDRVPYIVRHPVFIHVASGVYERPRIVGRKLYEPLAILGDGAGQIANGVPDDGFVELLAPTAAGGGSGSAVVVTSGLTVDAFEGKTIEMLGGVAKGDRRTLRDNTATDLTPSHNFSAPVASGDSFRIVESGVVFEVPSLNLLPLDDQPATFLDVGEPAGVQDGTIQLYADPGLYIQNVRFRVSGLNQIAYLRIMASRVMMAGVELEGALFPFMTFASDERSQVLAGFDTDGGAIFGCQFETPFALGIAPSSTAFLGWGLSALPGPGGGALAFDGCDSLIGFFVATLSGEIIRSGGFWRLTGGGVRRTTPVTLQSSGALVCFDGCLVKITPASVPFLVRGSGTQQRSTLITCGGGIVQAQNLEVRLTGDGIGILATAHDFGNNGFGRIDPGTLSLTGSIVITAPKAGVGASYGGRCYFTANPVVTLTDGVPLDEAVTFVGNVNGAAVGSSTFAALSEGVALLATPGDGTLIMRTP